ncbi:hypothetical protein BRADI_3g08575v3 [Brachypodium distachyon]|uniref:Uncharacterized protein n=1 Tax=Brachypodium distachyon TaxID=15368 RepID=A0A0Q3LNN0_BRADI|nr:hypothetical protein BRADI_3g08575v3 [Brachypodium distachyon]
MRRQQHVLAVEVQCRRHMRRTLTSRRRFGRTSVDSIFFSPDGGRRAGAGGGSTRGAGVPMLVADFVFLLFYFLEWKRPFVAEGKSPSGFSSSRQRIRVPIDYAARARLNSFASHIWVLEFSNLSICCWSGGLAAAAVAVACSLRG